MADSEKNPMADPVTAGAIVKVASTGFSIAKIARTLREQYIQHLAAKEEEFWQKIVSMYQAREPGVTEAEIEHRLHKLDKRENFLKAIMQSYRSLMESLDDSILPPLATITAEYLALGRAPDGFYRGTCRLLADLSFEEFESLKQIISSAVGALDQIVEGYGAVTEIGIGENLSDGKLKIDAVSLSGKPTTAIFISTVRQYTRLLQLLNVNGLAQNVSVWGGQQARINAQVLRKLDEVLNKHNVR